MVRDSVVVCVSDPEVAVTVTVEVPVATGLGFVALLVPLHPARNTRTNRSDSVPPPIHRESRNFFRFRIKGKNAANPIGPRVPSATSCLAGPRCRRETV